MTNTTGRVFRILLPFVFAALAIVAWVALFAQGTKQKQQDEQTASVLTGGGPTKAGHEVLVTKGCAACHEIPGIDSPRGNVGPSLKSFREQATIAGVLANSSENLVRWLQHPREVDPKTAMPDLGLTEKEARDAAAYLYAPN